MKGSSHRAEESGNRTCWVLGSGVNKSKDKIAGHLLDLVTHCDRITLQLKLVAIEVNIQVKILIFISLTVNEKTALRVLIEEFALEHLDSLSQRDWLKIMSARHAGVPPLERCPGLKQTKYVEAAFLPVCEVEEFHQIFPEALGNSYGAARFMLRQAQHERGLPVILSPAPFALSLSKGKRWLLQRLAPGL